MLEIESTLLKAKISATGAELKYLSANGDDNLIWKTDDQFWNRSAPILFPFVGKLKDNCYEWNGRKYQMMQHGFARNEKFTVVRHTKEMVVLNLANNHSTFAQYPFPFHLEVKYELVDKSLITKFSVINTGQDMLPFAIGGHPGFRIDGSLSNYELLFPNYLEAERHLIIDGLYSGSKQFMKIGHNLQLIPQLFKRDAIVFKQPAFSEVTLCKEMNPIITLHCEDWSAVGFWTKPGAPFFCIEPWWGWADNINSSGKLKDKEGLIFLSPNERSDFSFRITIH